MDPRLSNETTFKDCVNDIEPIFLKTEAESFGPVMARASSAANDELWSKGTKSFAWHLCFLTVETSKLFTLLMPASVEKYSVDEFFKSG